MSWIIPAVCGVLALFVLAPIIGRILKYRDDLMPTDEEVHRAEIDLHIKHLARMNGKRGNN